MEKSKDAKIMITNFIRLFFGTGIGSFVTILNFVNAPASDAIDILNVHMAIASAGMGLFTGILTCIFLFWQIKKIKMDLKERKQKALYKKVK